MRKVHILKKEVKNLQDVLLPPDSPKMYAKNRGAVPRLIKAIILYKLQILMVSVWLLFLFAYRISFYQYHFLLHPGSPNVIIHRISGERVSTQPTPRCKLEMVK